MSRNQKILVVEDDDSMRYVVSRLMKLPGYEVLETSSGQECLTLAREQRPDLILLDVRLPDLSGVEVCKRLKADPELSRILVILISGVETSPERQAEALDWGADGYLTKPFYERALLATVRAMFRIRSAERALVNQQEQELRSLHLHGRTPAQGAPAPLATREPALFQELLARYAELLDLAVEERPFREEPAPSEPLRELSERLGAATAGARDVVELHSQALKQRIENVNLSRAQSYIEEGRLLALELMGDLVTFYRVRQ